VLVVGLACTVTLGGCGPNTRGGGHPDGGGGGTLTSISIAPASANLTTTNPGAVATQQFVATGHFSDGHSEDLSAAAGGSVADARLGTIAGGAFTGAATRGGVATVTAGQGTVTASATITVKYVASRVSTDDGSTAPASSPGLFGNGPDDPTLAPALAY